MSRKFLPIVTLWPSICSIEEQQAHDLRAHALELDWLCTSPRSTTYQLCDLDHVTKPLSALVFKCNK